MDGLTRSEGLVLK